MATKKTEITPELEALIASAVAEAIKGAKPARKATKTDEEKAAKRAKNQEAVKAAASTLSFLTEVVFLPKRHRWEAQRVWSKTRPGPGLLVRFSPKDGSRQTWLVQEWCEAKSGNGFIAVARFVETETETEDADDTDDFLRSVG
jgi:hypothetical protein